MKAVIFCVLSSMLPVRLLMEMDGVARQFGRLLISPVGSRFSAPLVPHLVFRPRQKQIVVRVGYKRLSIPSSFPHKPRLMKL